MNFYQKLGGLILGSRLRRLSEYFLAEVNKVYAENNVPFDASWFSVFYLLSKNEHVSLMDIAETLEISHSAVSQLIKNLESKGLVETYPSTDDGRKRLLRFSAVGKEMHLRIEPIWLAIQTAMDEMMNENEENQQFFNSLLSVEKSFSNKSLSDRIKENF